MTKSRFGAFFHPIFAVDLVYDFMISVNNVSVVFGGFYLLDSVSFLINNEKTWVGLTGRRSREIDVTEDDSRFTSRLKGIFRWLGYKDRIFTPDQSIYGWKYRPQRG